MRQRLGLIIVNLMGIALLGYTAFRTYDLIQITLPQDQKAVGYLALVAFDAGVIGWLMFYLSGARGAWQRAIGLIMTFISLAGVILAFGADTVYRVFTLGVIDRKPDESFVITTIVAMALIIGANVVAVVALHLTDPNAMKVQAEEEANDLISASALDMIQKNAHLLAAEVAPKISRAWVDEQRTRYDRVVQGTSPKSVVDVPPAKLNPPTTLSANLSQWSVYAVARALHEQHGLSPAEAFLASYVLINGTKPSGVSEAQLKFRMSRPKTIPTIDPDIAQQARRVLQAA